MSDPMVKHVLSEIPSKEYMISDERKAELDAMYSPQAEVARLRAVLDEALEVVRLQISAWDELPEGRHTPEIVQRWLMRDMHPPIRAARRFYEKHKGGGDG